MYHIYHRVNLYWFIQLYRLILTINVLFYFLVHITTKQISFAALVRVANPRPVSYSVSNGLVQITAKKHTADLKWNIAFSVLVSKLHSSLDTEEQFSA